MRKQNEGWWCVLLSCALLSLSVASFPCTASAALEDVLYESGRITEEEWRRVKADKKNEAERAQRTGESGGGGVSPNTGGNTWVDRIVWAGDLRLRYGQFWRYGKGAVGSDRSRFRFRLRFGPTVKISDFTLGVLLTSGGSSQLSSNQTFDNAFSPKDIAISEAFASWTPAYFNGAIKVTGGKMKNPFRKNMTTDLLWDHDVKPEGITEQFKWKATHGLTLYGDLGQFVLNELSSREQDHWMFAWEGGAKIRVRNIGKVRVAVGYYDALNIQESGLDEPAVQEFNSRQAIPPGRTINSAPYVNDYNVLNVNGSVDTEVMGLPVNFQGDWVKNLVSPTSCSGVGNFRGRCAPTNARFGGQDEGYQVGVRLGQAKKARTWEIAYYYKWLQADAVLAAFADDDFGDGGTNRRGNIFWVAYSVTDFLAFKVKFYNTKPLERGLCTPGLLSFNSCNDEIDRLMVDWIWKF